MRGDIALREFLDKFCESKTKFFSVPLPPKEQNKKLTESRRALSALRELLGEFWNYRTKNFGGSGAKSTKIKIYSKPACRKYTESNK